MATSAGACEQLNCLPVTLSGKATLLLLTFLIHSYRALNL